VSVSWGATAALDGGSQPVPLTANKRGKKEAAGVEELRWHVVGHLMELEVRTCRARTSPKAADYIHLSRLFAKYAFFGLWQSSEDQDLSVPVISA